MIRKIFLSLVATVIAAAVAGGIAYATGVVRPTGLHEKTACVAGSTHASYGRAVLAAGPYGNVPTRQYLGAIAVAPDEATLASYRAAVRAAGIYGNVPTQQYLRAIAATRNVQTLGLTP
jgi:hypothetical protein